MWKSQHSKPNEWEQQKKICFDKKTCDLMQKSPKTSTRPVNMHNAYEYVFVSVCVHVHWVCFKHGLYIVQQPSNDLKKKYEEIW